MRQGYEPRFELHQILNTVLAAFLLGTAGFLYSVNNQLIITTEKVQVITSNLDKLDSKHSKSDEKIRELELRIK